MNYAEILDDEILSFINETMSFSSGDLAANDWQAQRAVYNRMAAYFQAPRPLRLDVFNDQIAGIAVRIYGNETETVILYAHGGGFVLGGLESHDDICAEIAVETGARVIAVDYRLAPEHRHPAAYDDLLNVATTLAKDHKLVLCGDSAGGTLCASVAGTWQSPALIAQVLIYPELGFETTGGSFEIHANAPLLSRDELAGYGDIRGGGRNDPKATPKAGELAQLPPTFLFPAECDPLHDDATRYRDAARKCTSSVNVETGYGLVHGWLRARHRSNRAGTEFSRIVRKLSILCRNE